MTISDITAVFVLIICKTYSHETLENEDQHISQETKYRNPISENILLETTRREYYEDFTQPSLKIERDDSIFAKHNINPSNIARNSPNLDRQLDGSFTNTNAISSSSFGSNNLETNGVKGDVDASGSLGSFGFHPVAISSGGGGAHSYNGGHTNFGGNSFSHGSPISNFGSGGNYVVNQGGGDSIGAVDSNDGHHNFPPIIQKSVYVHVAPPEEEVPKQKVIIPRVPPKKNYQIVFIKAPTPPPPSVPIIPTFPPQLDKTLIYVLHPKPEEAPPIHIPAPPQNLPVKPEVYFIRYKTRKEDHNDVNGDAGGYHRRYGRDEDIREEESADAIDTAGKTVPPESDVPVNQYE